MLIDYVVIKASKMKYVIDHGSDAINFFFFFATDAYFVISGD